MRMRNVATGIVLLAMLAVVPAWTQGPPQWNRKVEAVAVTPVPDSDRGGGQNVVAFFSVDAANFSGRIDLSTEVEILVNGVSAATQQFDVVGFPPGTTGFGCDICPPFQACWNIDGFLTCGPPLGCDPVSVSLQPEDEIMVLLRPAPGARPEPDPRDDRGIVTFRGSTLLAVKGDRRTGLRSFDRER